VELTRAVEPMLKDGGRISTVASVSGQLRNYSPEICALLRGGGMSTEQILDLGDKVRRHQRVDKFSKGRIATQVAIKLGETVRYLTT